MLAAELQSSALHPSRKQAVGVVPAADGSQCFGAWWADCRGCGFSAHRRQPRGAAQGPAAGLLAAGVLRRRRRQGWRQGSRRRAAAGQPLAAAGVAVSYWGGQPHQAVPAVQQGESCGCAAGPCSAAPVMPAPAAGMRMPRSCRPRPAVGDMPGTLLLHPSVPLAHNWLLGAVVWGWVCFLAPSYLPGLSTMPAQLHTHTHMHTLSPLGGPRRPARLASSSPSTSRWRSRRRCCAHRWARTGAGVKCQLGMRGTVNRHQPPSQLMAHGEV